eukprot:TRINITY_DN5962_c0_g4_i1.p1 TRINITY_DN5962_c0_g4~~TRINITY_DN5962_c0_g4_i1.p1  ORF type:complete len:816 (-),score=343.55 TRINITY_DN5962_c0_g4_i1:188-2635(-)
MLHAHPGHVNNNYRIIVLSKDTSGDRALLRDATCVLRVGSQVQASRLPFKEALLFDLEAIDPSRQINIALEGSDGRVLASGKINVPVSVETSAEVEREDLIELDLHAPELTTPIRIAFYTLYLNRTMYAMRKTADRAAETNSKSRSPIRSTRATPSAGKAAGSSARKGKFTHDELTGYLDKVIDGYVGDARLVIENKGIEESMYLSRFNRMIAGELPPPDLQAGGAELRTPERMRLEAEQAEMSPERLRDRYDGGSPQGTRRLSPSKVKVSGGPGDLATIMMNAEVRRHVNEYRNQIEYLKLVIFALDLKLKDHDQLKNDNEKLTLELAQVEEARRLLHTSITETTNELNTEVANLSRQNNDLQNEKHNLVEKLKDVNVRLDEAYLKLEKTEQSKHKADLELAELITKIRLINELKTQAEANLADLKKAEARRIELQEELYHRIHVINGQMEALRDENKRAVEERARALNEASNLRNRLEQEQIAHQQTTAERESLKKKLEVEEANKRIAREVQDQRDGLMNQLAQITLLNQNYERIIEEFKQDVANRIREQENVQRRHIDNIGILQKKNQALDDKINTLQEQLAGLLRNNAELRANISSLEQLLVVKDDVSHQLDAARASLALAIRDKEALRQQLDMGAEYIINQDEKAYDLQKIVIYLKGVIAEKDDYVNNLKKLIVEMKEKSAIYVPVKDDPIDRRLADYLNNVSDPNKLRVLFIRESEGVYQFGSKRIYVKVEMDKIMIRVGGGFLSLEEFLEQYVPVELERIARNDPVKILTNNLAVHKTVAGRSVNELEKTKTSQVNYRTSSPVITKPK